jgi:hypothetical protein
MTKAPKVPRETKVEAATETSEVTSSSPAASITASRPPTLQNVLNWLHTVDDWSVAGYRNALPRWIYVVAAVIVIDIL